MNRCWFSGLPLLRRAATAIRSSWLGRGTGSYGRKRTRKRGRNPRTSLPGIAQSRSRLRSKFKLGHYRALLTLGVILWLAGDFRDGAAVRAVLIGGLVGDVVNLIAQ